MVEPAIAITAMNIATLRPMFKNFFFFARKRFDHSIDGDDEEANINTQRPSGDSTQKSRRNTIQGTVSAKEYSVEFAEMLGLSRVGVTTEISAGGGSKKERSHLKKRILFRNEKGSESQTELNTVRSPRGERDYSSSGVLSGGSGSGGEGSFDWSSGIKATTVITTSNDR